LGLFCHVTVAVTRLNLKLDSKLDSMRNSTRPNGRAYVTPLHCVCRVSSVTLCTVAKRFVLEQKLLLTAMTAYRKS